MSIKLIVGLGNPGSKYVETRHNAGVWFVERLRQAHNVMLYPDKRFQGSAGKLNLHLNNIDIFIPSTYMNESGQSVLAIAHFYKILPHEILIAHDELDLPTGVARLKQGGGHAGHNGLRDVIAHLHSPDFWRLRIGINHPGVKEDVADYVLHAPNKSDRHNIESAIDHAISVMPDFLGNEQSLAVQNLHSKTS